VILPLWLILGGYFHVAKAVFQCLLQMLKLFVVQVRQHALLYLCDKLFFHIVSPSF
jgi:hypothetical protein